MTTVTEYFSAQFGETYWIVQWGPGMTQARVCASLAEVGAFGRDRNLGPAEIREMKEVK